ncbi:MAG TPA: tail fiber domain-containing protein, partial [Bryobacteraceae bacterium]|nr:tail fiber domain-containing protein [Bryobacteraceae bacterium]
TGASHTAVSIDAESGRDSVLYLSENGATRWGIRHDADQGHELDIRYSITPATSIEALKLTTNGNLIVAGTINGTIASNAIASGQILDGSVAAVDINATSFSTTFWKTDGNAGTTAGTHFVGTTDNQPLEFHANGLRALRLEPNANGAPNMIGGAVVNFVTPGRRGAVIGGGGSVTWSSPPVVSNSVAADFGTIGGGAGNSIGDDAFISTIGGGDFNRIRPSSHYGAIGGGEVNTIQTNADWATIGGGAFNVIQNGGHFGTIPGGRENSATNYGFAAGRRAKANHIGAFVWADSSNADFASTDDNQFLIRAGGGVGIGTPSPQANLHLYSTNNPAIMRIQSSGLPGLGRLEFVSDPQGSLNEWRPSYLQSTDNGSFTGGLGFFVNGTGSANKFNTVEVMRLVNGRVGINNTNPLHRLHVGVTRGTNAFNLSPNVIAIEDAIEDGRATFLALAGIGGPDSSNRVELQMEAVESSRRGIIGTTTEHPVHLRVGNSDLMVLATNRLVGIGTAAPANLLMVEGVGTTNGGVLGFPEVVGRFKRSGASHSAVSIDAETGRDSVLYLAENGATRWGIRHDADQDHELDIRYSITPATSIEALRILTNGTLITAGPVNPPSDRNVKTAFQPVTARQILEKVVSLPLMSWAYTNSSDVRHIGPVAQDFHAVFGVGTDDKHIATVDADGVALAAIQGLNQKLGEELKARDAEIRELRAIMAELKRAIVKEQ